MRRPLFLFIFVVLSFVCTDVHSQITIQQTESPANLKLDRERGLNMLSDIKGVLKERYYDKSFNGIDLDARFKTAQERVKTLNSNAHIFREIAQVLIEFDDSHTTFLPPSRANRVEYGFTMQMIGNNCFVTDVKDGSDAEKMGLKPGEKIKAIGSYNLERGNLWIVEYLLYALDPLPRLTLTVVGLDNVERKISFDSSFKGLKQREEEAEKRRKERRENPYRCQQLDPAAVACRLETFSVDKKYIDKMMAEAGKYKKLVLDLRGNGGGYVKIEEYLVGHFFDREVKIADFITRDKKKERIAKPQKERAFLGDLVVLIDSNSASASEVFARVIQIEKRGKIVGDVSAGAVMTSNYFVMANERGLPGYQTISLYGLNVTVADLIMSDGNRLEKVGVIPDYPVGPTGLALAKRTDPILAYAAGLMKVSISAEDAAKFNFLYKKDEDEDDETDAEAGTND